MGWIVSRIIHLFLGLVLLAVGGTSGIDTIDPVRSRVSFWR